LCSVTFREAAGLGIDNLEHGLIEDTDFVPSKLPDVCEAENSLLRSKYPGYLAFKIAQDHGTER
jgi:hypothetical protein